jgi:hypothetical protein
MEKLFFLFPILPILMVAQIHVDETWMNEINLIFENIERFNIQSGLLPDYAMEFTEVTAYYGELHEDNNAGINIGQSTLNI